MRIAIDGRYISDHFPGIGRYTYNLILALSEAAGDDTLVVIHNQRQPNTRYDMAALSRLPRVETVVAGEPPLSLAEQWQLPRLARRLAPDVWHAPYYIGPYWLPCPLVVTIHDAIGSRYAQYLPSLAARLTYQATMRMAMAAARRVLTDSEASRADLLRFFAVPERKVCVAPLAADARYLPQPAHNVADLRARLGLPEGYVLCLGSNKPHKNSARLVEAWAAARKMLLSRGDDTHLPLLLVAGRPDPRYADARAAADRFELGDSVRFLGDVAEADLPTLYSGARLFVFPSLYEGFGLPVLEAMACGAPVVCSTTPALLEVAGEAALTVDPCDVPGMAEAIVRVLTDTPLRLELVRRGREHAATFSWRKTASETMRVYRAAAGLDLPA